MLLDIQWFRKCYYFYGLYHIFIIIVSDISTEGLKLQITVVRINEVNMRKTFVALVVSYSWNFAED